MSRSTHLTSSHSSSGHRPHKALAALLRTVSPVLPRDVARIGRRRVRCNIRLPKARIHNYLQGRHIDTRSIDIRQCLYVVGQGRTGGCCTSGIGALGLCLRSAGAARALYASAGVATQPLDSSTWAAAIAGRADWQTRGFIQVPARDPCTTDGRSADLGHEKIIAAP